MGGISIELSRCRPAWRDYRALLVTTDRTRLHRQDDRLDHPLEPAKRDLKQQQQAGTPLHTLAGAQEFYRGLKERMRKYDRLPEALKVMPGLNAIVGRTRKEANELHYFLQSKIHADVGSNCS